MLITPSICTKFQLFLKPSRCLSISFLRPLSSSSSPYPLYYELIDHRPVRAPRSKPRPAIAEPESEREPEMDRAKRKYYRKRYNRMYGSSDSDSETSGSRKDDEFVELKPEIIDFHRLHAREQELYFYDAFAFPWEKEKHYRMVYQLEKKYFPDQCLDKAFVDPDTDTPDNTVKNEKGLVFFEEEGKEEKEEKEEEKKSVQEFFKCLKKVPNESERREKKRNVAVRARGVEEESGSMPVLVSRRTEFPARWDGAHGTVVLVDKPKGWTSFTVCGKLRRLVKVQKVGHAGTLDPMATGLLIVCVGKATKVVDKYQGMAKGYSGVFRLGEATSTWDADSPVIQREPWEHIKDDDIRKTAKSFIGDIWQVPPMFSAIKVKGEKMYDKARRGETVELSPRRISIFQFDIERSLDDRQNLIFRVTCSKGTYIRSLCADLGKALGSCAHLTALRRDSIGEYTADDAWSFQEIEDHITKGYF